MRNGISHDEALKGDREALNKYFIRQEITQRTTSGHSRQVLDFYHVKENTFRITFFGWILW